MNDQTVDIQQRAANLGESAAAAEDEIIRTFIVGCGYDPEPTLGAKWREHIQIEWAEPGVKYLVLDGTRALKIEQVFETDGQTLTIKSSPVPPRAEGTLSNS